MITLGSASLIGYVGPGPGLSMIGVLIGLLATLLAAFWAVAQWPLRVLLRRMKQNRDVKSSESK